MNRKALILYIRDLRDLEIAARRIEKLYQEEKKDYEQVLDSLENGKFMSEIEEPIFGVLMGCGVSDGIFLQLVKEISCTSVMELLFLWRCNLFLVYGDSFLICSYQWRT